MNESSNSRDRILNSARDLFHARSYGHVGVKEICDMAGVQKGSFYHFFPSKQELTLAVLDAAALDFKASVIDQAFRSELPPLQRLEHLMERLYQSKRQEHAQHCKVLGCPYGNIALELGTQDELIRQHIAAMFERLAGVIQATLEEAVQRGDIAPCNTAATATAMLSYIEGVLLMAKTHNDPELIRTLGGALPNIRVEQTTIN